MNAIAFRMQLLFPIRNGAKSSRPATSVAGPTITATLGHFNLKTTSPLFHDGDINVENIKNFCMRWN